MNGQNHHSPSSPRRPHENQAKPKVQRMNVRPENPVVKEALVREKKSVNGQSAAARKVASGERASNKKIAHTHQNKTVQGKADVTQKKNADFSNKTNKVFGRIRKSILKILQFVGLFLLLVLDTVVSIVKKFNRKLNVFRKSEATTIITNCAILSIIVSCLLCVYLMKKPSMDVERAGKLAANGDALEALRIVEKLERKGFDETKLTETKLILLDKLIEAKEFDEARDMLASMDKNDQTDALSDRFDYEYARYLYEKGEYSQAAQMFYQMQSYMDSLDYYHNCYCALAIKVYLDGQEDQAMNLLTEIPDAANRIQNVIMNLAGEQDEEVSARIKEAFNEENIRQFEQRVLLMTAINEKAPKGRIAAGYCHTLGLKADGTVYAAGDNMYGQGNVSGWKNVVQVAAGAYHSVALFKDGTVAAVGDNTENQLDVDAWTDIVAVAASGYDTIGLKADGTVVACGMHADRVSGWHGVTMVTGGAYSLGCLYDKGYMMSTHAGAQMDMSVVLFDLAVCGNVSAGILHDGTLVTNVENAPEWTNIVSIEVSSTGIFAIDANGKVRSYFYRAGDSVDFNLSAEAVEIASGGTHHVVLTKDGRVYSFGDNEFGQLNTASWNLQEG